ncbi:DUF2254 domain-containing protein [Pontibacillus marinus]|uniref:DUF2254 domain-containing protein n=1 Tax=Pontibacillus marinus BH030004 = DSM 16465 TaxID=1385511 RepID=A0A0A5GCY1_9BACI|nr:DUF2254 domain-containing protein [Pontibacillus marinus]KGX89889.1 hypothetical protein N783_03285 [Pontibacillus marinus BH030004 = DSM 16465]
MLMKMIPPGVRKYITMSKRLRQHELKLTLWYMPTLYISASVLLAILTLILDLKTPLPDFVTVALQSKASVTRLLVTTLIGGILTLTAYTLNSILVVLTTFSGQFSPRMLMNFVSDRRTQHVLGIFNFAFVYVVLVFIFITGQNEEQYFAVPLTTVLLALTAGITFIYFINHSTTWMQVHNITYNMKTISKKILDYSVTEELEPYRTDDALFHEQQVRELGTAHKILAPESGYVQIVDHKQMIEQARQDDIVLKLEARIGSYLLEQNPILSYWGETKDIDESKYLSFIEIGQKQREIQDLEHGLNKLSEIAIKAVGNNDPKTVSNSIHQLAELLLHISKLLTYPPYLVDNQKQLRFIVQEESFEFYLYKGYAYIRHYAEGNIQLITEIIRALNLLANSVDTRYHQTLWDFACNTVYGFQSLHIYELDKQYLLDELKALAQTTNNEQTYEDLKSRILSEYDQEANLNRKK